MLAQRSISMIEAIEIDANAYEQAVENILNCPWKERINAHRISFQEYFTSSQSLYDLIVCNPPYYKNSLKAKESLRNIARHNDILPHSDLAGFI